MSPGTCAPQNDILKRALLAVPSVAVLASEEDEAPIASGAPGGRFAVVFDPLDGSRNIEVSIPTGTIFGVYECGAAGGGAQGIVRRVQGIVRRGETLECEPAGLVGGGLPGFGL